MEQPSPLVAVIVQAFRNLGGVAQINELYSECEALSPGISQASIRNALQRHSSDATWTEPTPEKDYFYSVEGVAVGNGFWGLRHFSVQMPSLYPIEDLARAYSVLLTRDQTTLLDSKGICYRVGRRGSWNPGRFYSSQSLSGPLIGRRYY